MRFVLFIICLLFIVPAHTQNTDYQLEVPTIETYMEDIQAAVNEAYNEDFSHAYFRIRHTISQEFKLRYTDVNLAELPFSLLLDFQDSLAIGADVSLATDVKDWFAAMLEAGLRDENITDFSEDFTFGRFEITPMRVNVIGDTEEYLLHVYDGWSYRQLYALIDERVHMLPLPITGMQGSIATRHRAATGWLEIMSVSDIDDDGNDEIIVQGDSYGYWSSCGDLYVVDWQDDELVDRTGDLFHYCLPMNSRHYEFDYSQSSDIRMMATWVDGWNCEITLTDTLNMIDDTLTGAITYADTIWCDMREAGEAFTEMNYVTAANLYEQIIPEADGELAQYLTARLVLSFALSNQLEQAQLILDTVEPEGQMGELLIRLRTVESQPEAMCQAAADFFIELNRIQMEGDINPYAWTPENFAFGSPVIYARPESVPYPLQAGCDFRQFVEIEPTSENSLDVYHFVRWYVYRHLQNGEYEIALSQIDVIMNLPEDEYINYLPHLMYWRAVTLEFMGRSDEALVEYVDLYESVPDSAWGMLAALHFSKEE